MILDPGAVPLWIGITSAARDVSQQNLMGTEPGLALLHAGMKGAIDYCTSEALMRIGKHRRNRFQRRRYKHP